MANNNPEVERWYACRIFHHKTEYIKQILAKDEIQYFIPEQIIPSLVFIRTTKTNLHSIKASCPQNMSIYTHPGTTEAAEIPDDEMEIFMYVITKGCEHMETIDEKLVKGNHVRITGGLFQGAEGYITRIHGTKRFVVMIKGVTAVATTFIPRCFIEKIE